MWQKEKGALQDLFYKDTGSDHEASCRLTSPKASPNTITLVVRISTYELWEDINIQSIVASFQNSQNF